MPKSTKHEVTREGQRFAWLIQQLSADGVPQVKVAQLLGTSEGYVSNIKSLGSNGRTGFGAEIIRIVKDKLGIDPMYFFDDYEGERDYKLYLLSAKRDEKRVASIEAKTQAQDLQLAELRLEVLRLKQHLEEAPRRSKH